MKFSHKLSLAILALLAVLFSLGGMLLVRQVFQNSLDDAIRQNTGQHLLERYALEADLLNLAAKNQPASDDYLTNYGDTLTTYLGVDERTVALYGEDKQLLYSNLPASLTVTETMPALNEDADECTLHNTDEGVFMLMASKLETSIRTVWVLSSFDVTALFTNRTQNLISFWQLEAILLVCAGVAVFVVSALLTRPVKKLNRASRRIAAGAYEERVQVKSRDEIGELGTSFNAMAAAVQQQVEELNLSVQQRDDFVSAFTHEIKTPMTSLIGYSQLLRTSEQTPAVRQKAASAIYHEAKRLEELSQNLLELQGLSHDMPRLGAVCLEDIFLEARRSLLLSVQDVTIKYQPGQEVHVLAQQHLAADLLRNLLLNAVRSGPRDGTVRVYWRIKGGQCFVMVEDTGCGIPEKDLARITEAFYMVDKSRARAEGGSGIGLALSSRIAELHGSALDFQSTENVGTCVTFSLPLAGEGAAQQGMQPIGEVAQ